MGRGKEPASNNFYDRFFYNENPKLKLVDKISNTEFIVGLADPDTKETDLGWQITRYIYKDIQFEAYPAQGGSTNLRWVDRLDVFDPNIPTDGAPFDILLTNYTLIDGTGAGALISEIQTLTSDPTQTHTYTLLQDDANKFEIIDDRLYLIDTVNLSDTSYTILVETKDNLDRTFSQLLFLSVIAVPQFTDNNSVYFNGINQYARIPSVGTLFSTDTQWSWSVWLDRTDPVTTNGNGFFGIYVDADNYFFFGYFNNSLRFRYSEAGVETSLVFPAASTGYSNYIVRMDINANSVQVFEDGLDLGTQTVTLNSIFANGTLQVGFDGTIYQYMRLNDLSLWQGLVSAQDIVDINADGVPNDLFTLEGSDFLRGWWSWESSARDELALHNGEIINETASTYTGAVQTFVFIDSNRITDDIVGTQTPLILDNGQVLLEVTNDNDQLLTEYVKYTSGQIRSFDLSQSDDFQEFIDQRFNKYIYAEVNSVGIGDIEIISHTVTPTFNHDIFKVNCSGENVAIFRAEVNGSVVGKQRSYYTDFNAVIDLEGLTLKENDVLVIYAYNTNNNSAQFEASINYKEYLA